MVNVEADRGLSLQEVEDGRTVYRAWTQGRQGQEYFLLENRRLTGFDSALPAAGLLLWHVDEHQQDNTDENHYMVGLVQADGARDLEDATNRGDDGDCFPGSSEVRTVDAATNPSTLDHGGTDSLVRLRDISDSATPMTVDISVTGAGDGSGDAGHLAQQVQALTQRVTALESALASVAQALLAVGPSGGSTGSGSTGGGSRNSSDAVVDVTSAEPADLP